MRDATPSLHVCTVCMAAFRPRPALGRAAARLRGAEARRPPERRHAQGFPRPARRALVGPRALELHRRGAETSVGKFDKKLLRALYAEGALTVVEEPAARTAR